MYFMSILLFVLVLLRYFPSRWCIFLFLSLRWLFKEGTCRLATGAHLGKPHNLSAVSLYRNLVFCEFYYLEKPHYYYFGNGFDQSHAQKANLDMTTRVCRLRTVRPKAPQVNQVVRPLQSVSACPRACSINIISEVKTSSQTCSNSCRTG